MQLKLNMYSWNSGAMYGFCPVSFKNCRHTVIQLNSLFIRYIDNHLLSPLIKDSSMIFYYTFIQIVIIFFQYLFIIVSVLWDYCTAVLPANFSQGGSRKEHLILSGKTTTGRRTKLEMNLAFSVSFMGRGVYSNWNMYKMVITLLNSLSVIAQSLVQ